MDGFTSNSYAEHSPGGYTLFSAALTEVVMTMMFLLIIMGATDKRPPTGFAPIAIGLGLNPYPSHYYPSILTITLHSYHNFSKR
jgi:glycerol uptake facilitator-like aquaporin